MSHPLLPTGNNDGPRKEVPRMSPTARLPQVERKEHWVKATHSTESIPTEDRHPLVGKGREDEIRHYRITSNGVLGIVDAQGDRWVGRPTEDALKLLKDLGYSVGKVYVPHAQDGGKWIKENFDDPKALEDRERATHKKIEEALGRIQDFDTSTNFILASGTKEKIFSIEYPRGIERPINGVEDKWIGHYWADEKKNIVTFVDTQNKRWVGRVKDSEGKDTGAIAELEKAGYQAREMYIPHAQDPSQDFLKENFDKPRRAAAREKKTTAHIDAAQVRVGSFPPDFPHAEYFVKATGTKAVNDGQTIVVNADPGTQRGHYFVKDNNKDNVVLSYVDPFDGTRYVGRPDPVAIAALEKAGYTNRIIFVPHSEDPKWMIDNFDGPKKRRKADAIAAAARQRAVERKNVGEL